MPSYYHPSDTISVVKSEFILTLTSVYNQRGQDRVLSALNSGGIVSRLLRNQIRGLSSSARVWTEGSEQ